MAPLLLLLACVPVPAPPADDDCPVAECEDLDGDGSSAPEDCDDADPSVHPEAVELCDGVDRDCDGTNRCTGAMADAQLAHDPIWPIPDVHGDGFDDLLWLDMLADEAGLVDGRLALEEPDPGTELWFGGGSTESFAFLGAGGDLDGDGLGDVLLTGEDVVYLFLGATILADDDARLPLHAADGTTPFDFGVVFAPMFGTSADIDGDGGDELFFIDYDRVTHVRSGAGILDPSVEGSLRIQARDGTGGITSGDHDGDGLADLAVASYGDEGVGTGDDYSVHVFFGPSGPWGATLNVSDADVSLIGQEGEGTLAPAVVGDVDGDGLEDLGVEHSTGAFTTESAFHVVPGTALPTTESPLSSVSHRVRSDNPRAIGSYSHGVGDRDGDGLDDIGVRADEDPLSDHGSMRIFFGSELSGAVEFETGRIVFLQDAEDFVFVRGTGQLDGRGGEDLVMALEGGSYVFLAP